MNCASDPSCRKTLRLLLAYLIDRFGMAQNHEPTLLGVGLSDEAWEDWTALGDALGLRIVPARLTLTEAAHACGSHVVALGGLERDAGFALCGFSAGKARIAVTADGAVQEKRSSLAELAVRLGAHESATLDWLVVEPSAPLGNAVSPDAHGHLPPLRRLAELMRPERADLWLIMGLAVGSSLLALAPPVAVQALVNSVAMGGMGQPLLVLSTILFFLLAFSGAVYLLESYLTELVQRRIFVRLAADLAQRLPKVRGELYDRHNGAELVNRFFDALTLQKAGSSLLLDGVALAMQGAVGLTLLAFYHPFLLAFDLALLLAIAFILGVLGRGGVDTAIAESKAKYAVAAWLETVADNPLTFKFDGGPHWAAEKADELAYAYLSAKRGHYRVLLRQSIGSLALYAVASTALLAIGGYLVIQGQLTLGQLVAAELIVSSTLAALIKFGKHVESFYDLLAGVDKIGHLLDLPLERQTGVAPRAAGPAGLSVRNLRFGYSASRPAFERLNFDLRPGERVALLGGHGSGKTGLAQILCGLREIGTGRVELDGADLGEWRLDALRARVALVCRPEIVEGSLSDNLRSGRTDIPTDDLRKALDAVGLPNELSLSADAALNVELSPNGLPLSGAQVSQLTLARAIAGKPGLLILDGILDDMEEDARRRIASMLCDPTMPWTLLVLTRAEAVAALCGRSVELPGGNPHA